MAAPYQEFDPECKTPWLPLNIQSVVSNNHFYAIGLMLTQWAYTSKLFTCAICDLQHWDTKDYHRHDSHIIPLIGMGDKALIGILKATFKLRFSGECVEDCDRILDRLGSILEIRDLLAHTQWKETDKTGIIETFNIKGMNTARVSRKRYSATGIYLEVYKLSLVGAELGSVPR